MNKGDSKTDLAKESDLLEDPKQKESSTNPGDSDFLRRRPQKKLLKPHEVKPPRDPDPGPLKQELESYLGGLDRSRFSNFTANEINNIAASTKSTIEAAASGSRSTSRHAHQDYVTKRKGFKPFASGHASARKKANFDKERQ